VAHPKHDSVRARFHYRCGYCGISEVDAGGELTVDHYHPVSAGGGDNDENLVYACIRCNQYKSDFWPAPDDVEAGNFILHPLRDDVLQHLRENELTGELEPLTETGRFHIGLLDLNRPQLVAHRQRGWVQSLSDEIRQSLKAELADLRSELRAYARYASQLERLLGIRKE
jgi:hypothetical protein